MRTSWQARASDRCPIERRSAPAPAGADHWFAALTIATALAPWAGTAVGTAVGSFPLAFAIFAALIAGAVVAVIVFGNGIDVHESRAG